MFLLARLRKRSNRRPVQGVHGIRLGIRIAGNMVRPFAGKPFGHMIVNRIRPAAPPNRFDLGVTIYKSRSNEGNYTFRTERGRLVRML